MLSAVTFAQKQTRIMGQQTSSDMRLPRNMVEKKTSLSYGEKAKAGQWRAAKAVPDPSTLISEQPEGTLHSNLYRSAMGYYVFWGYVFEDAFDGVAGSLVEAADGSMYMQDPFSGFTTGSWLKLDKAEDDTLVMKLPQMAYQEEYQGSTYNYYAYNMILNEDQTSYIPDTDNPDIKFVWRNDSLIQLGDGLLALGSETGGWTGYGDYNISMATISDKPATPADASQAEDFKLIYGEGHSIGTKIKAMVSGSEFWVCGLLGSMPEAWVKGTISGDKVTFASKQYMGVNPYTMYHAYFFGASAEQEWDDYYQEYYTKYTLEDDIVFSYDATSKTITAQDAIVLNAGFKKLSAMSTYDLPIMSPYKEVAATPANPKITDFSPYDFGNKYGYIKVDIPMTDVDGNFIDPEKMYYNMYVDGDVFTFYADEYTALGDEMTDVPYFFTDNWDLYVSGVSHTVYYYMEGFDTIGFQSVYTGGGETNKSEIITFDAAAASIKQAIANHGDITGVSYTDLSGRMVETPAKGIYVKTIRFADGTSRSYKMVVR